MQTFTWGSVRLNTEEYRVNVSGGHQLQLRRCLQPDDKEGSDRPVAFLLPGFLSDSSVFFPPNSSTPSPSPSPSTPDSALAPFLAAAGFDVFVADLRGKGGSWPAVNKIGGLHEAIVEELPAHLQHIARLRPASAQVWIGAGLGSVLLVSCYARLDSLPAPVLGMAHFGPVRYSPRRSWAGAMAFKLWCACSGLLSGYVSWGVGANRRRESLQSARQWQNWQRRQDWRDPVDNFDYRRAIQEKPIPPSLYMVAGGGHGGLEDSRRWIDELGAHDVRLLKAGMVASNRYNYNSDDLLRRHSTGANHFTALLHWSRERFSEHGQSADKKLKPLKETEGGGKSSRV